LGRLLNQTINGYNHSTRECTHCGYEVPIMILLRDLKGTVRLDRSKYISVHVSTCTKYDFNTLTPVVWKLWR